MWRAALFRREVFIDVARNWRGIGVRYLLLLLIPAWLIGLITPTIRMNHVVNATAPRIFKDFPTITIVNGTATSDCQQPYIWNDPEGKPYFVFDTTGKVTKPSEVHAQMLMTSTEIVQENAFGQENRNALKEFPDTTINTAWFVSWFRLARNLMIPVGAPLMVLFSLAWRLLFALLLAAIGKGMCSAFRIWLPFPMLMRLAIVCMTGSILLDTLLWLANLPFVCGFSWFLQMLLTVGYMIFAINAIAKKWPGINLRRPTATARPSAATPPPLPATAMPEFPARAPRPRPPEEPPGADLFP